MLILHGSKAWFFIHCTNFSIFNTKKSLLQQHIEEENTSTYKHLQTITPSSANPTKWSNTLKQFVGNLPTNCLSVFHYFVKLVVKELKDFPVTSKSTLWEWCKKLGFWYKGRNKKMELYQLFAVDIVSLACNGVKNDTPTQVLSCEYWDFLSVTLFKTQLQRRCFLVIFFGNFPTCNSIKKATPAQVFSCKLSEFFSL